MSKQIPRRIPQPEPPEPSEIDGSVPIADQSATITPIENATIVGYANNWATKQQALNVAFIAMVFDEWEWAPGSIDPQINYNIDGEEGNWNAGVESAFQKYRMDFPPTLTRNLWPFLGFIEIDLFWEEPSLLDPWHLEFQGGFYTQSLRPFVIVASLNLDDTYQPSVDFVVTGNLQHVKWDDAMPDQAAQKIQVPGHARIEFLDAYNQADWNTAHAPDPPEDFFLVTVVPGGPPIITPGFGDID